MRHPNEPTQPAYGYFVPAPEPVPEPKPEPTPIPAKNPLLLSLPEAAELLGVGKTLVQRLINDGALPSFKIGGRRLIRREDVEAFVHDLDIAD